MKILILNGPNLNLLGEREQSIYGSQTFDAFLESLREMFPEAELIYAQSNVEGELINHLHEAAKTACDGVVLNGAGYTHTSVALGDAVAAISIPVVEVHISNVHAREPYRHQSLMAKNCKGVISGFGLQSYVLAIRALLD